MFRTLRFWASCIFWIACLTAPSLYSQTIGITDNNPGPMAVKINALAIDATIRAGFAHIRLDVSVFNPSTILRGGIISIPLPADATIKTYFLEVNGVLIEGVPVPKARARQVYEAIQNKNIDPGLVEYAQGNIFRTRVYPVPANGSRRLVIEYVTELEGTDLNALKIPLQFDSTIDQFGLKVTVLEPGTKPQASIKGLDGLKIGQAKAAWLIEAKASKVQLKDDLLITLPTSPSYSTLVERSEQTVYFASHVRVASLGEQKTGVWKSNKPSIDLYIDTSLSARERKPEAIIALLQALAKESKSELDIRLIAFRNVADTPISLKLSATDANDLRFYLQGLVADGGSRFDNLPAPRNGSLALIVTDGMSNLGSASPAWPIGQRCVLLSGKAVDVDFARRLANEGGQVLALDSNTSLDLAKQMLSWAGTPTVIVENGQSSELRLQASLSHPGIYIVSGVMASPKITLSIGFSGGKRQSINVDASMAEENDLARHLWAGAELKRLLVQNDAGSAAWQQRLSEFGQSYGIVTPGTSLLVLESLEQYLEYNILPPASMADWRTAYVKRSQQEKQDAKSASISRIDRLANEWAERLNWWKTDFSKVPDTLPTAKKEERDRDSETRAMATPSARMSAEDSAGVMNEMIADMSAAPTDSPNEPKIEIKAWTPDRPYLRELSSLAPDKAYEAYVRLRKDFYGSPAFFLDVGDWFSQKKMPLLAARIWTSMADLGFNDVMIQRILANRLAYAGDLENAITIFTMVKEDRPDEPQSSRDLALVLIRADRYAEAAELLYTVATGAWSRNQGVELIALGELNRYLTEARKQGWKTYLDPRLEGSLDCDLRVVMAWDTDQSDMDLWVTEPNTFKVFYGAANSLVGGHISRDITNGYGPEEYTIRKARKGTYTISSNYYGSRNQDLTGNVTVFVSVYTNWGRANEKRQDLVLQLSGRAEVFEIGKVTW